MQTQTRRLQKVALLASRQEAEFVSGVLEAADLPHAIVEADQGLELRVDSEDAARVQELIERLDVKRDVVEAARQRTGEANGRRLVLVAIGVVLLGLAGLIAAGMLGNPGPVLGAAAVVLLGMLGALSVFMALVHRAG